VISPIRLKPSDQFLKSRGKIGEPIASRAETAISKFYAAPTSPGLNFEAVKGRPGFFTIRVNRNFRILLKEEEDNEGPYYLLADIGSHDDIY
jgi:hypothetical protein